MSTLHIKRTDVGCGYTLVENLNYMGSKILERNNGPSLEFFLYDEDNDKWRMFHRFPDQDEDYPVDCSVEYSDDVDAFLKGVLTAFNRRSMTAEKKSPVKRRHKSCFRA